MTEPVPEQASDRPTTYFRWLIAGLVVTVMAASAVNLMVDPYYVFDLVTTEGFNKGKPAVVNRTGFAKTHMVARADVVIAPAIPEE